jgi:hypothetical protein
VPRGPAVDSGDPRSDDDGGWRASDSAAGNESDGTAATESDAPGGNSNAGDDGGVPPDPPDASDDLGIYCGQVLSKTHYCDPTVNVCCVTQNVAAPPTYKCADTDSSSCTGLSIPCDSDTECPAGNICCATFDLATSSYTNVACSTSCDLKQNLYQLCNANAVPSECVTSGTSCQPSTALSGFSICE